MQTLTQWAVTDTLTGRYLPSRKQGRGFTNDELTYLIPGETFPRLFASEKAARTAATWWKKGVTRVRVDQTYWGEDETVTTTPRPSRESAELLAVQVTLTLP
jgi:hypothetical protein|tara:strand:+ start:1473 stop:1778 length:306 start_codon:yes stop_codon:yes gene_type:complete